MFNDDKGVNSKLFVSVTGLRVHKILAWFMFIRAFIVRVIALEPDRITAEARLTHVGHVLAGIHWRWLIITTRKEILCSTKLRINGTLNNVVSVQVVCLPRIVWQTDRQTDTSLVLCLPVTSYSCLIGCRGYHVVLRRVLCAVRAEE